MSFQRMGTEPSGFFNNILSTLSTLFSGGNSGVTSIPAMNKGTGKVQLQPLESPPSLQKQAGTFETPSGLKYSVGPDQSSLSDKKNQTLLKNQYANQITSAQPTDQKTDFLKQLLSKYNEKPSLGTKIGGILGALAPVAASFNKTQGRTLQPQIQQQMEQQQALQESQKTRKADSLQKLIASMMANHDATSVKEYEYYQSRLKPGEKDMGYPAFLRLRPSAAGTGGFSFGTPIIGQ